MLRTVSNGQSIHPYIPRDLQRMFYKNPAAIHASQNGLDPYGFSIRGLVLYLPLFAQKATTYKSVDAYEHTVTRTGGSWQPYGMLLDGDDYTTIPDHAAFDITTNLSVWQWVYINDISVIADIYISNKYATIGDNRDWAMFKTSGTGKVTVRFGDPLDGTLESTSITDVAHIANGTWVLLGFTYDTGTLLIYADGVSVAYTTTFGAPPATLYNGTADIILGKFTEGTTELVGRLGEGGAHNVTLSAEEMLDTYNKTKWRYR